ncbi:uncharacterized protein RHIMIDRAFT_288772 [Rhizopus microsporus ATCC 52813]|uniref:Uncharacterized protein n=1 Tax=Rhizopus microsporus ATCC 52813 TaxID=1340429 RepID=A0A2G4TBM0_RHIZD|nr:uncharacterized protein RHIMIDRAFT_288772 [Rhizopus microsporus ATCC 52813]PHZ18016.1 hypothetical protein RHIMIDRAFT_288772 [Rhizopus microsporus ATCC 52813]
MLSNNHNQYNETLHAFILLLRSTQIGRLWEIQSGLLVFRPFEVSIKRLQQLGFSQYDISTVIGMKRTTAQAATDRMDSTGTTLTGMSTYRLSTFD